VPLIPKVDQEEHKSIALRLPVKTIELIDAYARYVNGDRPYVVDRLLRLAFAQDAEFARARGLAPVRRRRAQGNGEGANAKS
jgi:hypothetical protein